MASAVLVDPADLDNPFRSAVARSSACRTIPTFSLEILGYTPFVLGIIAGGVLGGLVAWAVGNRGVRTAFWLLVALVWLIAAPADFLLWGGIVAAGMLAWRILQRVAGQTRPERDGH